MRAAIQLQMVLDVERRSGTLCAVELTLQLSGKPVRILLMPINVVCTGCMKRFQVADAHAGKTGPCPSCQKPINIPRPEDEVVIQEPENFGPTGTSGRQVLKPVAREDTQLSVLQWILIAAGVVAVVVTAFVLRGRLGEPGEYVWLLAAGSLLVGFPVSIAGYSFLRDAELESYQGTSLFLRAAICALVYTAIWGLYAWTPQFFYIEDIEAIHAAFFLVPFCCIAAIAPLVTFDLDYTFALIHCGLFVITTALLGNIIGITLY